MRKSVSGGLLAAGVTLILATESQPANAYAIFTESFEGALQAETVIIHGGSARDGDFWSVLPSGTLDINYPVGGIDGSSYFGGRDFGGAFAGGVPRAVEFRDIDISLYTNVKLTVGLSSRTTGGLHSDSNYEANDVLRIMEEVDGGGPNLLDSFDGDGQDLGEGLINDANQELTQTLIDFTYDISAGGLLTVRIDTGEIDVDQFGGGQEAIAFDNIRITGDPIAPPEPVEEEEIVEQQISVPEPATLALFGLGLVGLGFTRKRRK